MQCSVEWGVAGEPVGADSACWGAAWLGSNQRDSSFAAGSGVLGRLIGDAHTAG